jgi:hypothetical protein
LLSNKKAPLEYVKFHWLIPHFAFDLYATLYLLFTIYLPVQNKLTD